MIQTPCAPGRRRGRAGAGRPPHARRRRAPSSSRQSVDPARAGASISASVSWLASRIRRRAGADDGRQPARAGCAPGPTGRRAPAACPSPNSALSSNSELFHAGPTTLRVDRPRRRRQVGAVDRRAAGGVGDDHPVAEQLGDQLDVGRLAAAGAGARELEERLEHLRAPLIVSWARGSGRAGGCVWKKSQRSRSSSRWSSDGSMLMALWPGRSWTSRGTRRRTPHSPCSRPGRPGS